MLAGDKTAIIFFLRATGYGEIYPVELTDPKDGSKFIHEIDISQFQAKPITLSPDGEGECVFTLPISKSIVKFKYLTSDEEETILSDDASRIKKLGSNTISMVLTNRLSKQVMEIDGERSKGLIQQKIEQMKPGDSGALRKYITDNEPGLDLKISVEAPSGEFFFGELPITSKFLWPFLDI